MSKYVDEVTGEEIEPGDINKNDEIDDDESATAFMESRASFAKSSDEEINARVQEIYDTIREEVGDEDVDPDVLRAAANALEKGEFGEDEGDIDDLLDDLHDTLLKVKGFRVDPSRATGPKATQIIANLVQARDFLTELRSEGLLPLVKQRDAADVLIGQFEHEITELQRRSALVKSTPRLLASDGERIDATARDIITDHAVEAYYHGTPEEQHEAANAVLDEIDFDATLDRRAERIAEERNIPIPEAHLWASQHDALYKSAYTDRAQKLDRRDAKKRMTGIDTAAHEERLRKDRDSAKNVAYKRLLALARQAGVDVEDKKALEDWLRNTTDGRTAAEEYARFGSQVRRRTARE